MRRVGSNRRIQSSEVAAELWDSVLFKYSFIYLFYLSLPPAPARILTNPAHYFLLYHDVF